MKDRFNLYRFASPATFYPLAGAMIPYFAAISVVFGLAGLWLGMLVAPTDFQQGEGYRIIFIHVPASWMSMFIYLVMAFWAAIGLAFNTRLSGMMAQALAPTGALMAFLTQLGTQWNISLFHYRNHGAAYGRVLVGLQLGSRSLKELKASLDAVGYPYSDESTNPAYQLFLR